jgi:hypothetical protein
MFGSILLRSLKGDFMLSLTQFAELAAIISAMADVYSVGRDTFADFLKIRREAPDFQAKGEQLKGALSTYSDAELDAISDRIEGCRDRFIAEGSGKQRKTCLCSVLSDVKEGSGSVHPILHWHFPTRFSPPAGL